MQAFLLWYNENTLWGSCRCTVRQVRSWWRDVLLWHWQMSVLTHSNDTLMPCSWLPITWTCTSTTRSSLPLGFTKAALPRGLGGFCKTWIPKAVVLLTRGLHVTSLCCLFKALTQRGTTAGCTLLLPTWALCAQTRHSRGQLLPYWRRRFPAWKASQNQNMQAGGKAREIGVDGICRHQCHV